MNKQYKSPTKRGIEWADYTWNPIAGCFHACQWSMPNGTIANCYAEDVADRVAQKTYPQGFEHNYWHPDILNEPAKLKTPSRIFVGSMADVFGHWVEAAHIQAVLDAIATAPQHIFQMLTKNPVRAKQFTLPRNVWLGCSTPPDFMWNKPLTPNQQARMFEKSLSVLGDLKASGVTTWISAEPLSWNVGSALRSEAGWIADPYQCSVFDWIVIGAASNGSTYHQPKMRDVRDVLGYCEQYAIPVFMKGNLKASQGVAFKTWREDFPLMVDGQAVRS